MPVDELDNDTAQATVLFVEMSWETNPTTYVRYVKHETDLTFNSGKGDQVFTSMPGLEFKPSKKDGTVRAINAELEMSSVVSPFPQMRSTFPPVVVKVWEADPSDPNGTAELLEIGSIKYNRYNHNGNPKVVRAIIAGPKDRLDSTISLKLGRFCDWTLGLGPCKYDRESNRASAQITAIEGNKITLGSAITSDPGLFRAGGVRFRGFEVGIHKQENSTTIYTIKPVPLHWLNETVDILPGCDKTIDTCRERGQESQFVAIGIAIPNRDIRIST